MDSKFRFLVARPSNRHGRRTALEAGADPSGNRRFESGLLQQRVRCEPNFSSTSRRLHRLLLVPPGAFVPRTVPAKLSIVCAIASDRRVRMGDIPSWHIVGDWFDNCSCAVPCTCTFAQAPDNGFCESVLFWRVREGHYGEVKLD